MALVAVNMMGSRLRHLILSQNRFAALAAGLAIAVAIGYLTLTPPPADKEALAWDKLYHFVAFFALMIPFSLCTRRCLLLAIFAALAFGGAIEILQPLVGRDCDLDDFLADAFGVSTGAVMAYWLGMRQRAPTS
ncbi:VanZ family protein [Actibacterium pelagium]|nr:VanZ family protein [Actibacterium pelagium]